MGSHIRAAHAVDVIRSTFVKHAAGHVVYLNIRVSRRPGSPAVSDRIVFKRMGKLVACHIGAAAAHSIKLPVGREEDADDADPNTWEVGTGGPIGRATCDCVLP